MEVSLCPGLDSRLQSLVLVEKTKCQTQEETAESLTQNDSLSKDEGEISEMLKKGLFLSDDRKYEEAEALFTDIIATLEKCNRTAECIPYLCEAYNNLGLIQYKKVEFNKALSSYNKSIQVNKAFAPAYYNQGTIYYRLGFHKLALEKMTKALCLQPRNEEFQKGYHAASMVLKNQPWMSLSK